MSLSIVTNTASMMVRTNLTNATDGMNTAIERMTTGFKINNAKDDAAGYNIMDTMTAKIGSYNVAADNCQLGLDMLTTAEENYALITDHLQRIRDLTVQASNDTYSTNSLKAIRAELIARMEEIDRVAAIAEYNGFYLMNGDIADDLRIQASLNGDDPSGITLSAGLFAEVTCKGIIKNGAEITTMATNFSKVDKDGVVQATNSSQYISAIDFAILDIATRVTNLGAAQNRLESAMVAIDTSVQQLTNSRSSVRDADVAEESTNYIQYQILQSAASTLLATANQTPSIALQLI